MLLTFVLNMLTKMGLLNTTKLAKSGDLSQYFRLEYAANKDGIAYYNKASEIGRSKPILSS